jgi:hypothetical protein
VLILKQSDHDMQNFIYSNYYAPNQFLTSWNVGLDADTDFRDLKNVKQFDEWFSPEEYDAVEAITLLPGSNVHQRASTAYKRFADLRGLKNLKYLGIPLEVVPYIDIRHVSQSLEHLAISPPSIWGISDFSDRNYKYTLFNEAFPSLKTLRLFASPVRCANFDVKNYPNLLWFAADYSLDKAGAALKMFKDHPAIQGFEIFSTKDKKTLQYLRNDCSALYFWSITTKGLDFSFLNIFDRLRYLTIIGSSSTIDCSMLKAIPNLTELCLISCKNIINLDALQDCLALQKLEYKLNDIKMEKSLKTVLESRLNETLIW